MSDILIDVAKDFSPLPTGRHSNRDGDFTGELFLEKKLYPNLQKILDSKSEDHLIINFDGVIMAPPSFIDEAFGGLIRKYRITRKQFSNIVTIVSRRQLIIEDINNYMNAEWKVM